MGLAEKRAVEEIKTKMAEWGKQICAAAQTNIPIEVKWDTLVKEDAGGYAVDAFEKVFVGPLVQGFQKLCNDDIGKKAVADGIKKIVIKNEGDVISGSYWATFENGILTLDHRAANVDYGNERAEGLVEVLSKAL